MGGDDRRAVGVGGVRDGSGQRRGFQGLAYQVQLGQFGGRETGDGVTDIRLMVDPILRR